MEKGGRSTWGYLRLGVLLFFLIVVGVFGLRELRYQTRGFKNTQNVVVLIASRPGAPIAEGVLDAFRGLKHRVEAQLLEEIRYHGGASTAGVDFLIANPITLPADPPEPQEGSIVELLRYNWSLDRYVQNLVELSGFHSRFETVLVLIVSPTDPESASIEGISQKRGHYGIVNAELSRDSVDFAWFVLVHEYLHTRGASDKYDGRTAAAFPSGFAEPEASPLYPQASIELMARGRPLSETTFDVPGPPETWRIGDATAKELGLHK
jgi:hypothetical protein